MAKQKGAFQLEGCIGGLIFYKNKHGYFVRSKGGIARERIATEPRFARTRETGSEFGYAARLGKVLRLGVQACCPGLEDRQTYYRLSARLMKIIQQDAVHARGERRLSAATAQGLEGFAWKEAVPSLPASFMIDADTVRCHIPAGGLRLPPGATHLAISLAVLRVDEGALSFGPAVAKSGLISDAASALTLSCAIPSGTGGLLMAGVGMEGYQEVNGRMVFLREGSGFWVGKVVVG